MNRSLPLETRTNGEMSLTDHLTELRRRLIRILAAVSGGTLFCYWHIQTIMAALTAPAGSLYYMKPAEAFLLYIKAAVLCGTIAASPVIFYELWAFLLPAFTRREKKFLLLLVPSSLALFLAGISFSYFFVLPQGLHFFLTFSDGAIQPLLSIESYLEFLFLLVLPFGCIFNVPLLLTALAMGGVLTSEMLQKARRYVILGAFILAAVITPTPDVFTQVLLALPILFLYEVSRLVIRYVLKK